MAFDGLGDLVPARVTQMFERASDDVFAYRGAGRGEALGVTGNHPFLMPDGSFKPFGKLIAGQDRLVAADGTVVPFGAIRTEHALRH